MALRLHGDGRHDNNRTPRRFRCPAAPELPTPQFKWIGNSQYEPIIPGALCQFRVKAYTPGGYWRVFYKAADELTSIELNRRFSFSTPAQVMWLEMAAEAYDQRIEADRAEDEAEVSTDYTIPFRGEL